MERRLLESVADIAYLAGAMRYHSGDSRKDVHNFIKWAQEFETLRKVDDEGTESYNGQNYLLAIETFTEAKLKGGSQ